MPSVAWRTLSGRQGKSLTGALLGFLSNVNISVVVGADFAIGDNETLLHLVETVADVTARRSVEFAAYEALRTRAESGIRDLPTDQTRLLLVLDGLTR